MKALFAKAMKYEARVHSMQQPIIAGERLNLAWQRDQIGVAFESVYLLKMVQTWRNE